MLKAVIIDDELPCVEELSYLLGKYPDIEVTGAYTNSKDALDALERIKPGAVFLDIDMPHMNGLELALKIQAMYSGIIIIFVTAYAKYALDAFNAYPLDFLLKPIREARLDAAVTHMRGQYELTHPESKKEALKIKCFGRFEVLAGSEIKWGTHRVRELFLYLIGRCGTAPTKDEIIDALFGGVNDKKTANNLYVTLYKLRSLLDTLDGGRKLIRLTEDNALEIAPGICDFTDFMGFAGRNAVITGKNAIDAARALNLCTGMYLKNEDFVWATDTAEFVETEYERIALGLAEYHIESSSLQEAEAVLNTLLLRNPLCDDGYAMLLDMLMKNGNHQAFSERYAEYARVLKRELKVKPREIYRKYFNEIKN
jgi:two-component system, LytTR family, response regulator